MKTLYVIRHAKSSWADAGMKDFDRPLNDRGLKDAPEMAIRLKNKGVSVDLILSSTAKRAKTTALAFANMLGIDESEIVFTDDLYEADISTIYNVVHGIEASSETVLLFGHNPTLTYFVNDVASVHIDNIPTCGVAEVVFDTDWAGLTEDRGRLLSFDYPKNI